MYAADNRNQFLLHLSMARKPDDPPFISPFGPVESGDDYALLVNPLGRLVDVFAPASYILAFDRAARLQGRENLPVLMCDTSARLIPEKTLRTVESLRAIAFAARAKRPVAWSDDVEAALARGQARKDYVAAVKTAAESGEWTAEALTYLRRWPTDEGELVQQAGAPGAKK
jgi:hypothetical protein